MPAMTLQLHKTYRNSGFFNVRVDFDRYVARQNGLIEIFLDHDQNPIRGHSDRDINPNRTPRIFGNQSLRRYFQKFPLNARLQVEFLNPTSIRIWNPQSSDATTGSATTPPPATRSREHRAARVVDRDIQRSESRSSPRRRFAIGAHLFEQAATIQVARSTAGHPIEELPHSRFRNVANLSLHQFGAGPFCRLVLGDLPESAGVYAITSAGVLQYVGECVNLRRRFGPFGYGAIHPRNCYQGGQPTNCRLNHFVLLETKAQRTLELWFLESTNRKEIEAKLIRAFRPTWNRQRS